MSSQHYVTPSEPDSRDDGGGKEFETRRGVVVHAVDPLMYRRREERSIQHTSSFRLKLWCNLVLILFPWRLYVRVWYIVFDWYRCWMQQTLVVVVMVAWVFFPLGQVREFEFTGLVGGERKTKGIGDEGWRIHELFGCRVV